MSGCRFGSAFSVSVEVLGMDGVRFMSGAQVLTMPVNKMAETVSP